LGTTLIGLNVTGTEENGTPLTFSGTTTVGAVAETGSSTETYANWGRWTSGTIVDNGVVINRGPAPNGQFHYIFGELTPPDVVAAKQEPPHSAALAARCQRTVCCRLTLHRASRSARSVSISLRVPRA
jgi:hypothetical protein